MAALEEEEEAAAARFIDLVEPFATKEAGVVVEVVVGRSPPSYTEDESSAPDAAAVTSISSGLTAATAENFAKAVAPNA